MKKVILLFTCSLIFKCSFAQIIDTPYEYPVKPGMEEWKQFHSGKQRATACQIPPDILQNLTTKALVQTCLNYPLFMEVIMANNLQDGFNRLSNDFNGFQELLSRKDAGRYLLQVYQKMNLKKIDTSWSPVKKGDISFKYTYIELLLAQPQILNNLSIEDKDLLKREAVIKFENKNKMKNIFGMFGLNTSALILGRIIRTEGKENILLNKVDKKSLNTFLSTGTFSNKILLMAIYNASK